MRGVLAAIALGTVVIGGAAAQDAPPADPPMGVVVVDREAVFAGTGLGRRMLSDFAAEEAALIAENREIEETLTAEEAELAARRPDMETEAFRAEAAAFDARVTVIRETQDAKTAELLRRRDALADRFWAEVLPILGAVMADRGAGTMLDRGAAFLTLASADVTADVVRRIDAVHGPAGAPEDLAPDTE